MRLRTTAQRHLLMASIFLICAAAAHAGRREEAQTGAALEPRLFRLDAVKWTEPYNGPLGYPKGAQRASLGVDPVSGGETYYARFPAGSRFELHWHAHPEYAVLLRGKVTRTVGTTTQIMSPGDYVIIPAKMNYCWSVAPGDEAFLLIRRDGPADFNFVAQPH